MNDIDDLRPVYTLPDSERIRMGRPCIAIENAMMLDRLNSLRIPLIKKRLISGDDPGDRVAELELDASYTCEVVPSEIESWRP